MHGLRCCGWQPLCCRLRRRRGMGAGRPDPDHRRDRAGRRNRSLCPRDLRAHGADAGAADHHREQAGRERRHRGAVHRRPAGGRLHHLARHPGVRRDRAQHVSQRALVDRPVPSIIRGVEAPLVFVTAPSVPAGNLAEFIAWARANRGKLSYSSYQAGTPSHFLGFQMNEKWDLDLTHVPYRGSGLRGDRAARWPFAVRLRAAQFFAGPCARRQAPCAGDHRVRPRALHAGRADLRRARLPRIHRQGLVRPAGEGGHAPGILARYTDAAKAAHADPAIRQKLEEQGFEVSGATGPQQLKADIKEQTVRWGRW